MPNPSALPGNFLELLILGLPQISWEWCPAFCGLTSPSGDYGTHHSWGPLNCTETSQRFTDLTTVSQLFRGRPRTRIENQASCLSCSCKDAREVIRRHGWPLPSCCLIYSPRVPTFMFSLLALMPHPIPTFPPPILTRIKVNSRALADSRPGTVQSVQKPDNIGSRQRLFFHILLTPSPDTFLPSGVFVLGVPHLGWLTISDCLGLSRFKNWKSCILGNLSVPGDWGQSPAEHWTHPVSGW